MTHASVTLSLLNEVTILTHYPQSFAISLARSSIIGKFKAPAGCLIDNKLGMKDIAPFFRFQRFIHSMFIKNELLTI